MGWGSFTRRHVVALAPVALAVVAACAPAPSVPPATTTTTTTTATPPTTVPAGAAYPGAVPAGRLRWGANTDADHPVGRHEDATGRPLALHRTFWRWDQRAGSMPTAVRDDLAHDRLPWVSVKPGGSWADMGAGAFDGQIDEMLRALDATGGPVWLTLHHEPEGGGGVNAPDDPGGPVAWRAMQRRIRQRMDALGTTHVAFAPILMSWTFDPRSSRDPDDWWEPGVWDFFGIDHYVETETSPQSSAMWTNARRWIGDHGLDLAVGEWGMRGTDEAAGQRVRGWYEHAIGSATDGQGARVVGMSAFDCNLNSATGGWELRGGQLTAFRSLLADPRTLPAHG